MTLTLTALSIWGFPVVLRGFDQTEVGEIEDTFAGAVSGGDAGQLDEAPVLTLERVREERPLPSGSQRPRHRGGSSARKYHLDGSPFSGTEQHRDILESGDGTYGWSDDAGTATVHVTGTRAELASSGPLPHLLLSDLVEDWLLTRIRAAGAVQVHCSAWLLEGAAHLVVGSSGVGKTTELFGALCAGAGFLSNDRAFLRVGARGLEVRSFPLQVNVGCGTIRSLGLDLPHYDLADDEKIRLRAPEVVKRFGADYLGWYPVAAITCRSVQDFDDNAFWVEDPSHPWWIRAWRPDPVSADIRATLDRHVQTLLHERPAAWR